MTIDRIRIATPCRASWERMEGDERVRHCAECKLNVYNFAEMTRDEVRALLARSEGRVCARLYRRDVRRRVSRAAAAIVAALLSLPAFAKGIKIHGSKVTLKVEQAAAQRQAALTGFVVHEDLVLPGVTVVLRNEATGQQFTFVTDVSGAFHFASLTEGAYRADLQLMGFKTATIEHLELKPGAVTHAIVTMRLDINEQFEIGVIPAQETHEPMKTTFTQSFIEKLP